MNRARVHALLDELLDAITEGDDWVSQKDSPLGKAKHLELARDGKLPSTKEGRLVMIKRSDIDAYLASKRQKRPVKITDSEAEERDVQDALAQLTGTR